MQNFFGFIDYTHTNISKLKHLNSSGRTQFHEQYSDYSLFLSFDKSDDSKMLNNEEILLFLNGTISNKSQLIKTLQLENRKISSLELLRVAYQTWDIKFLKNLEGKFSLIIYDKKRGILFLAKDKVGAKPINFYHSKERILFSSHLSQLKELPNFNPVISPKGLASYLQFGCILQPNSIFEGCYKIKSGYYNHFDLIKKEYFDASYWTLESCYYAKKTLASEREVLQHAHTALKESIEKNYPENKKIGVSLSGGYDSSTIASLLQNRDEKKLNTFTIGFTDQSINEAKDAKAIAQHLGTEHHEHYFQGKDALRIVPQLCKVYDEPFAEYAATPTILTAELLKKEKVEHIFVGDGGDEVFATADDTTFFERIHAVPYFVRRAFTFPFKQIPIARLPYLKRVYNLPTKYEKFFKILSSQNIPQTIEARNILFREEELELLVLNYNLPLQTTFDGINFEGYHETVDEIIGTYFKTTMTDGELVKSYGAMNHYNIGLHTPFLDEKLIAYMATVPASIKIKNGIKKYILKEIAHEYIPKKLLDRPKSGFDIPFSSWMRGELKELVYSQINEKRLNEDKLFYTSSIIQIRDNFYQGNNSFKYKLWRIFIFQLWYENFKG
jgi:asparagine synthase (glutamine-hydrolysing)